jgi:hypothetical protein
MEPAQPWPVLDVNVLAQGHLDGSRLAPEWQRSAGRSP